MNAIKRMLGIAPTKEDGGRGYIPSPLGLRLGVPKKSTYEPFDFGKRRYRGAQKVLVLCTEDRYFKMSNGKLFSTGNNVAETAVPLMHLAAAGFDFDVVTPTGKPAVIEEWSTPSKDEAVLNFMATTKTKFAKPLSLEDLVGRAELNDSSHYAALFLPGGHGAMVGLPDDENVGTLIRWIKDSNRYLVAVCHGPAAMLATKTNDKGRHPYAGYELCAFPDNLDERSPSIGYLPGRLPWLQCEKLEAEGMKIVNKKADGTTHVDRKLFSGDSPMACDDLGKMIAEQLLTDFAADVDTSTTSTKATVGGTR